MKEISNFTVKGLFGFLDVNIPIQDNRIILVGVNGLGKSTILTILYYFLSRQWHKLVEIDFNSVSLTIVGRDFSLDRNDLQVHLSKFQLQRLFSSGIPRRIAENITKPEMQAFLSSGSLDVNDIRVMAAMLDMPERHVVRIHEELDLFKNSDELDLFKKSDEKLDALKESFAEHMGMVADKILFLPTYRRIEKDLADLFPTMRTRQRNEMLEAIQQAKQRKQGSSIELIEFGMEDVQRKIDGILLELKDFAHSTFKKLAGSNFKEVVHIENGADYTNDLSKINSFSDQDIDRILNRVEEDSLREQEKQAIIRSISKIKDGSKKEPIQQLIAHFFIQLSDIDKELTKKEEIISRFINSCNKYLEDSGKRLNYDNQNYKISINWDNKKSVDYKALSSGEKQVVSIFSDLYLSDYSSFALIIDEPELSLSIGWQKKFLPEIMETGRCNFIAAATHSPFIFENALDQYATDIRKFCHGF